MAKSKKLSRRQLAVIEALFSGELDEQAVLDKYKVSRNLYNKWQTNDTFIEHFESRIAASHRRSAALIAGYAPLAAAKLVQLTESEKVETARKACLDIISMPLAAVRDSRQSVEARTVEKDEPSNDCDLTEGTVSRLLEVLAEEKAESPSP